ncbi:hypothetical protein CSV61_16135 [Sporosarcina sp. P3]|uniref:hypothetical protein n=1 Tax=Sporosarcina TaxID=1569 RepID=UPI000C16F8C3|nr:MULTISPECIES: hypothetical protein [Sporosarcina]PID20146.1 hypothetical protein CSV61_16135 [Sporosarcina sp. P3]
MTGKKYTEAGTNIEDVKKQNANSGLTYNEVKELIAKEMMKKESPSDDMINQS